MICPRFTAVMLFGVGRVESRFDQLSIFAYQLHEWTCANRWDAVWYKEEKDEAPF
jgi:hypothetical protein